MSQTETGSPPPDDFSQVVEQHNGEVAKLLDRLTEQGIGRPLCVAVSKGGLSKGQQERLGVEIKEEVTLVKVGHALRADKEGLSHIIIDLHGNMIYIKTYQHLITEYQNLLDELGTENITYPQFYKYIEPPLSVIDGIRNYPSFLSIAEFKDGRHPENYPFVQEKFNQALKLAGERRTAIEQTKQQMQREVVAGLTQFLSPPPETPPPSPTPPAPPPTTPTTT